MSERAAYSRVYWSIFDDDKFVTILDNDHHLACWLRLLLVADQAHPASAHLPVGTRRLSVVALVDADLLVLGTGSRYRIKGLDAERERRRALATTRGPSGDRPVTVRSPSGIQTQGLRRDETRKDETRRDRDGRDDLEAFLLITRHAPTPKQRRLLDEVMDRHDLTGPAWAADLMYRNPMDPIGAVIEADKAYRAERIAAAQAAEAPKPIPRRPRGLPTSTRELMADFAKANKPGDAA